MQVDRSVERAAATPLLFEFIVDASGRVLFVDAKSYPWPVAFGSFWEPDRPWLWRDMQSDESVPTYTGPCELRRLARVSPPRFACALNDCGLLWYFITYALRSGRLARLDR
jgi:hypothetical protein